MSVFFSMSTTESLVGPRVLPHEHHGVRRITWEGVLMLKRRTCKKTGSFSGHHSNRFFYVKNQCILHLIFNEVEEWNLDLAVLDYCHLFMSWHVQSSTLAYPGPLVGSLKLLWLATTKYTLHKTSR